MKPIVISMSQRWSGRNHKTMKPIGFLLSKYGVDQTMKPRNHETTKPQNPKTPWVGWRELRGRKPSKKCKGIWNISKIWTAPLSAAISKNMVEAQQLGLKVSSGNWGIRGSGPVYFVFYIGQSSDLHFSKQTVWSSLVSQRHGLCAKSRSSLIP